MIELERTFLLKYLPDLSKCRSKEIIDIYIPKSRDHPKIRIRKNGDKYEITKKEPIAGNDSTKLREDTINLMKDEFEVLAKLDGKRVRKIRYYYDFNRREAQVDVFQEELMGLVLVDFEFDSEDEMKSFEMPDFCLADVSQEKFLAGGYLCGRSYEDIEEQLKKFNYNTT